MNWNLQYEINKNRIGETILYNVLCAMYDGRTDIKIENVACDEECYHLGDIRITNSAGKIYYFDAKNDGRINETGNVFCEDYKKFYSNSQKILFLVFYNRKHIKIRRYSRLFQSEFSKKSIFHPINQKNLIFIYCNINYRFLQVLIISQNYPSIFLYTLYLYKSFQTYLCS